MLRSRTHPLHRVDRRCNRLDEGNDEAAEANRAVVISHGPGKRGKRRHILPEPPAVRRRRGRTSDHILEHLLRPKEARREAEADQEQRRVPIIVVALLDLEGVVAEGCYRKSTGEQRGQDS